MPEYHLVIGGPVAGTGYFELDEFTQGYIEALFFTENSPAFSIADIENNREEWEAALSEGTSDGQIPGDAGFEDLSPDALAEIIKDCAAFQLANRDLLAQAVDHNDYSMEGAGRDYWYSRNGHGVGFWDRGLGSLGDRLHDACKYREVNVWWGDDGKVHLS